MWWINNLLVQEVFSVRLQKVKESGDLKSYKVHNEKELNSIYSAAVNHDKLYFPLVLLKLVIKWNNWIKTLEQHNKDSRRPT